MNNDLSNYWYAFFLNFDSIKEIIKPYAQRSGISTDSAILLTVYSEFPNLNIPARDEFIIELINKGLVVLENEKTVVTSKGAILAKAFISARNSKLK